MAFVEDRKQFLRNEDFAETVTLGSSQVLAIFDHPFGDAGLGVAGRVPVLLVDESDIASLSVGAAAVVRGVSYTVRGIEPDGTGFATIVLERV